MSPEPSSRWMQVRALLSVQDLASKKTVQVKITSDSQLHKIPPKWRSGLPCASRAHAAGNAGSGSRDQLSIRCELPRRRWTVAPARAPAAGAGTVPADRRQRGGRSARPSARCWPPAHVDARRSAQRRCGGDPRPRAAGRTRHSDYIVERSRTDSAGRSQCQPGDDADALEPGRRLPVETTNNDDEFITIRREFLIETL